MVYQSLLTRVLNIYTSLTGQEQERQIDALFGEYMGAMKKIAIETFRDNHQRNEAIFYAMKVSESHFNDKLAEARELRDGYLIALLDSLWTAAMEAQPSMVDGGAEELELFILKELIDTHGFSTAAANAALDKWEMSDCEAEVDASPADAIEEEMEWEAQQEAAHDEFVLRMHDHLH